MAWPSIGLWKRRESNPPLALSFIRLSTEDGYRTDTPKSREPTAARVTSTIDILHIFTGRLSGESCNAATK
jgi:hypothetical protein